MKECIYCNKNVEMKEIKSQYNDVDGDYDDCIVVYCPECRMTNDIKIG